MSSTGRKRPQPMQMELKDQQHQVVQTEKSLISRRSALKHGAFSRASQQPGFVRYAQPSLPSRSRRFPVLRTASARPMGAAYEPPPCRLPTSSTSAAASMPALISFTRITYPDPRTRRRTVEIVNQHKSDGRLRRCSPPGSFRHRRKRASTVPYYVDSKVITSPSAAMNPGASSRHHDVGRRCGCYGGLGGHNVPQEIIHDLIPRDLCVGH